LVAVGGYGHHARQNTELPTPAIRRIAIEMLAARREVVAESANRKILLDAMASVEHRTLTGEAA
jgi:hypothetical protein